MFLQARVVDGSQSGSVWFVSHREVGEDVDRLNQFTSELIVEAVVRCIRVIDPALGEGLPTSLPPGMSARFRVGMSLAQACQVRLPSYLLIMVPQQVVSRGTRG